jgi:beta-glucosidase
VRSDDTFNNALAITIGTEPDHVDANELITSAAAAAAAADVAIVVIGTNSRVESEGYDRVDLSLPGQQDALVEAVLAANPRTVVVVNSGSPVELPWRERAAAVLVTYFGGQEYGNALGDMLSGRKEPGGRLPTTWPGQQSDVPVLDVTPVGGVVTYEEGIHVGYRAWLKADARPAFPFGHGLGYTTWALEGVQVTGFGDGDAVLTTRVRNAGERAGKHVVQVYAEHPGSTVDRPVRWLVGFAVIRAEGGEAADVEIPIRRRELAYWDGDWVYEPGEYVLRVGSSVVDLPMSVTIHLQDPPAGVPETLASMPDLARSYEIR